MKRYSKQYQHWSRLKFCEFSFLEGDDSFISEHEQWEEKIQVLTENGYSYEEAKRLRDYYKEKISDAVKTEKQLKKTDSYWRKNSGGSHQ